MRMSIAAWICLAPVSFAGQVRVVGPVPAPYPRIQDAINDAQPGDVVLVKTASHDSMRVHQKWLTIVADTGLTVQESGAARVTNLDPRAMVVLSGIACQGVGDANVPDLAHGLVADSCTGQIILQDCTFRGVIVTGTGCAPAARGALVKNCSRITFTRCTLWGGSRATVSDVGVLAPYPRQGRGLDVLQSNLWCSGVTAFGGSNGLACPGSYPDGANGGNGFEIAQSTAFASGSTFLGGGGGDSAMGPTSCAPNGFGGSGGNGVQTANSSVYLLATSALGSGGGMGCGVLANGGPGYPIYGTSTAISGSVRTLNGPRLVRDVNLATFTFTGAPGELVEIAASLDRAVHVVDVAQKGVLQVLNPRWRRVGVVPPTGTLTASYKLPNLPLTNPGATFVVQARFTPPASTQSQLSNAHVVVEVDATY